MAKVKVKVVWLGHIPHNIDSAVIEKWNSELFEVVSPISTFTLTTNSNGWNWEFDDEQIESQLPYKEEADLLLAITNVSLEENYYARRFSDDRVCLTFHQMADILYFENISLENLVLRVLYSMAFVYKKYGRMPLNNEATNFTHDETRGCIFDMNGIKTDVVYSTVGPIICEECTTKLKNTDYGKWKVEKEIVDSVKKELNRIKKDKYYQVLDYVKRHPVRSFLISSAWALFIGGVGSLLANLITS